MQHCKLTLICNAGIVLELGRAVIWSDVLHDDKTPRFSSVTPELAKKVIDGGIVPAPDLLLYSHCHRDHYSQGLTERALAKWPAAQLILPREDFPGRQLLLDQEQHLFSFRGLQFRFGKLTHQGADFAHIPNYGVIINAGGFRILMAGDCTVESDELGTFVGQEHIDLAIMGFPWVSRPQGRAIIDEVICPDRLVIYHLPFAEDNWAGLREKSAAGAAYIRSIPDMRFLWEPFQTMIF
ncbi:MAG: MBL fold metallo-hydrolase [Ruminococcaceae bacterium]|nr:MBL fold metallo-hydrolase [Oscillospiraceae bacterium]